MKRILLLVSLMTVNMAVFAFNATQMVTDARSQIGKTLYYDPAYTALRYPMGDVPLIKGVCTDVVIRALRQQGIDLQKAIHEDMKANFKQYPQKWGLKSTDKNIDHRRVPNIQTWMLRQGFVVKDKQYLAGDIVTWDLGRGLVHIGVVSDRKVKGSGVPLIIHNIGEGTQEEDILHAYQITGHYRVK